MQNIFFDFPLPHTLTPKTNCTIRKERYNTISYYNSIS